MRSWKGTLLIVALIALLAAGCGSQATVSPGGAVTIVDLGLERARIGELFADWEAALEAYDVNGMLAPVSADLVLSIREQGVPQPDKDYATLKTELEVNAPNQLRMRAEDGYEIDIAFQLTVAVSPNGTARVTGSFSTVETIKHVAGTLIHESGTIDADLVKSGNAWLIREMILDFHPGGS